jgi:hypothetical protein
VSYQPRNPMHLKLRKRPGRRDAQLIPDRPMSREEARMEALRVLLRGRTFECCGRTPEEGHEPGCAGGERDDMRGM